MAQARVKGFAAAKTTEEFFLQDFAEIVRQGSAGEAASWLIANKSFFTEKALGQPFNWNSLGLDKVLALRAFAPVGAFTEKLRKGLEAACDESLQMIFLGDYDLIVALSRSVNKLLLPEVVELMKLAYQHGIRPADSRVKNR